VVEVNVPTVIAAPAVVGEHVCLHRVEIRQIRNLPHPRVDFADVGPPVTVASPRIERAVVTGLLHRVKNVAKFDDVPAPAAVADIDAGARHVVNRTVPDGDVPGEINFHARGLFLHAAGQ